MKSILKVLLLLVCLWMLFPALASAQDIDYIPKGRYLVIGTFHMKDNAIGFTDYVKQMDKYEVKMSYHPIKKYYYVYIKGYQENESGSADVDRMRKQTEFIDTWYMVVEPYDVQGDNTSILQTTSKPLVERQEPTEDVAYEELEVEETNVSDGWVRATSPEIGANDDIGNQENPETGKISTINLSNSEIGALNSKIIPKTYADEGKYKMFFNTYYTKNFKEVKGTVEVINPKSLRLLRVVQSLSLIMIRDPNNGDHSIQLIANIFGYKKVQHDIKLDEPFNDVNEEFFHFKGDTLVVDFPLQRYETGDIATMYNVFFFKDAAIMKPNSKFEINSLVDMLKENDELKIKIHGHTNGNASGKIITPPQGSEEFFSLNQEVEEKFGSAKELSKQRAEVIKRYLMYYGIAAHRMEVNGWGGKKPIYDKMDKLAVKNVRVEIEILDN